MPPEDIMHQVFQRRQGQNGRRQNQRQNRGVGPNQNRNVQPVG